MHSRIYQISTKPIHKDDYISEDKYYDHWFLNSVADYVNDDTDRAEDIQWFKDCYEKYGISFGVDDSGEYFIIEDKLKYFEANFKRFKEVFNELSSMTLEEFADGKCSMSMYQLKEAYEERFGFYVDGDEIGMSTLDEFVRYANETKWYIGATIDYHC